MKAKEKVNVLKKLSDDCNPNDEAMLAIYATAKKGSYFTAGDIDLVHRGVYEILAKGIAGEEGSPTTKAAWAILEAVRDLRDEGVNIEALLDAFDEEEDFCPDCNLFDACQNEKAKAWRIILDER